MVFSQIKRINCFSFKIQKETNYFIFILLLFRYLLYLYVSRNKTNCEYQSLKVSFTFKISK